MAEVWCVERFEATFLCLVPHILSQVSAGSVCVCNFNFVSTMDIFQASLTQRFKGSSGSVSCSVTERPESMLAGKTLWLRRYS